MTLDGDEKRPGEEVIDLTEIVCERKEIEKQRTQKEEEIGMSSENLEEKEPEIRFVLDPYPVWVPGDHQLFDTAEYAIFPKSARAKLRHLIRPLGAREEAKIREQCMDVVAPAEELFTELSQTLSEQNRPMLDVLKGMGLLEDRKQLNQEKFQNKILNFVLPDWRGFNDEEGNPIECSLENKLSIFDGGYPKAGAIIIRIARMLMVKHSQFADLEEERAEGNLESSQDGPPPDLEA